LHVKYLAELTVSLACMAQPQLIDGR
jgi:hypothetical protein